MSLLCLIGGFWDTLRMGLRTGEWTPVSGHVYEHVSFVGFRCVRCGCSDE